MADADPHRPPVELLRPVLEVAVELARAASKARPARPVPALVRPVLRFRSLPASALETVRRAIDTDTTFRSEVAAALGDDTDLNAVSRLWLRRPDGWIEDVAALLDTYDEPVELPEARHARELAEVRAAAENAGAAHDAAVQRADAAAADLLVAREELARLATVVAELTADRDRLVAERARAVRELKATEKRLAERTAEVRALRASPTPEAGSSSTTAADAAAVEAAATDPAALLAALRRIGDQLDGARAELDALAADADLGRARGAEVASPPTRALLPPPPPAAPARTRRVPVPLPGGVVDSSIEAAAALARVAGVVFVVDGYNVSQHVWSGTSASAQRRSLERALAALSARTRARFEVVYDGSGDAHRPARSTRSSGVHTRFAPADIPADDVVIEVADSLADLLPVVVVSTDREVRDAAARHRIRTITSAQLAAVM